MKVSEFMQRDNNNLNFIRLILALLVIYYHAPVFINPNGHEDIFSKYLHFAGAGYVAVQTFFLISGLLITNSLLKKSNPKAYLVSRIFRIMPGLVVVSLISGWIGFFLTDVSIMEYSSGVWEYTKNNFLLNVQFKINFLDYYRDMPMYPHDVMFREVVNGSIWTIPFEFKMYLLVLSIWLLSVVTSRIIMPLCFAILLIVNLLGINVLGGESTEMMVPNFFLGAMLAYYKDNIELSAYIPLGLMLCGIVMANNIILNKYFIILGLSMLFVYISSTKLCRIIHLQHDISYGVYLWGWPVEMLLGYCIPSINFAAFIVISMMISILIAYVQCRIVEEPCLKIATKINNSKYIRI